MRDRELHVGRLDRHLVNEISFVKPTNLCSLPDSK